MDTASPRVLVDLCNRRIWIGADRLRYQSCSRKNEETDKKNEEGAEVTATEDLMREHGVLRRLSETILIKVTDHICSMKIALGSMD